MGSCCVMSCLLHRCRHANGRHCHSPLHHWSCLGWPRRRFGFHFGPSVPVRVFPKVDSWSRGWPLPVGNHHWHTPCQYLQQRHQESAQSFFVSHPNFDPVRLGCNSCLRYGLATRGALRFCSRSISTLRLNPISAVTSL